MFGGLMNTLRKYDEDDYYLDDDYEFEEEEDAQPARPGILSSVLFGRKPELVEETMRIEMKKPKNLDDSREISERLLDGSAVIINFEGIDYGMAQRITDFVLGTLYAIDGDLKIVSKSIFIAAPKSIDLSGEFIEKITPNSL